jgi:predicted permease
MFQQIFHDLSKCGRVLLRNPGYSLAVVAILALGIGASTAMFGLLDALLLRPLPVVHPSELVRMVQYRPKQGTYSSFPYAFYESLHDGTSAFSQIFGEAGLYMHFALTEPGPAEQVTARGVTPDYFESLGVAALYGRALAPRDAEENANPAVLSYDFWKRHYHADASVIGQTLVINGQHFVIVGVMPSTFKGISVDTSPDLRIPLRSLYQISGFGKDVAPLELAGRLKPGITLSQGKAQCLAIWQGTMRAYLQKVGKLSEQQVEEEVKRGLDLETLQHGVSILRDRIGNVLKLVTVAMGLLLAVLCANVAGLVLARVAAREREMAVQLAMGANRSAISRQFVFENLLLTLLGSGFGFLVALAATPLLIHFLPPIRDVTGALVVLSPNLGVNERTFAFITGLMLLVVFLLSLGPAAVVSRLSLDSILRDVRASSKSRGRQALIALQMALCSFALVAAALFVRTFQNLRSEQTGLDIHHVATFSGDLTGHPDASEVSRLLVARTADLPGVVSVALSSRGIMRGGGLSATAAPAGERITPADFLNSNLNIVSPGYFETMGMQILSGRDFTYIDATAPGGGNPAKVVVNAAFIRHIFPNTPPIGKTFGTGTAGPAVSQYEIIGVVSDAKYRSLREPIKPTFYRLGTDYNAFVLNVRTREHPDFVIQSVRRVMASLSPDSPFVEISTLEEQTRESSATEGIVAELASGFGAIMALLVAVGIYGLLTYIVTLKRREVAIRIAMGARPVDIARFVTRQTLGFVAVGTIIGLLAAFAAGSFLRAFLYGISPNDPKSVLISIGFVFFIAAAATCLPVLRAVKVEPSSALRGDA